MKKLNIGVIGAGAISSAHLAAYRELPEANLYVVCDVIEKKARRAAENFGAERWCTDYVEVLEDSKVDVVDICLPHYLHAKVVIDAARYGKDIICEKPIAITVEEGLEMVKNARKNGVKFMVAHNQRFLPTSQELKKLIEEEILGDIYAIYVRYLRDLTRKRVEMSPWMADPKKAGGGIVIGVGIHMVDLLKWVLEPIVEVSAVLTRFLDYLDVEDNAVIDFRMTGGTVGSITLSWTARIPEESRGEILVLGDKGSVVVDQFNNIMKVFLKGGKLEVKKLPHISTYKAEIKAFLDCIINDEPEPVPAEEALDSLCIIQAIYNSARVGKRVKVQYIYFNV